MNVRDSGSASDGANDASGGDAAPAGAAAAELRPEHLLARRPEKRGERGERDEALRALFEDVEATPWAHDFFALLRRIEGLSPDVPRLGRGLRPSQEAIRLGQEPELDFAPAALASLTRGQGPAPRLGVRSCDISARSTPRSPRRPRTRRTAT